MTRTPLSARASMRSCARWKPDRLQEIGPSQRGDCCDCCGRMFLPSKGVPTTCQKCLEEF